MEQVHCLSHSLPSNVYSFLSESAEQILVKLGSVNTRSSPGLKQQALPSGESADSDKWANVTTRSGLSSAAEARHRLFIRAELLGMVVAALGSAPAAFDGRLDAKNPWQQICREAVNLSASLPARQLSCDRQPWTNRQVSVERWPGWTWSISYFCATSRLAHVSS